MSPATSTAPAPRLPVVSRGALLLVGDETNSTVPEWVLRWCEESGREPRRLHVPVSGSGPGSADRVSAIAAITAGAARRGDAVLALPALMPARSGPPRVVAAVRRLPDDSGTLGEAAASARHLGAELVVAHGLPASFGERSIGLDSAVQDADHLLEAAVEAASAAAPDVRVGSWLARVRPHELVGEPLDADLLVLGGPHQDRPDRLGLVARSALFHAPCPVLLTPRPTTG
jgi:nucleotide-binding universal stress UspA family protein